MNLISLFILLDIFFFCFLFSELSNLRYKKINSTNSFNEVQQVKCVQGSYPSRLLDLWDLFEEVHGSENDCPEIFPSNQLFIVLQLANGGKDLESYVFNNAKQAYAMFEQVIFNSLIVISV